MRMKPTELAAGKLIFESVRTGGQSTEELYNNHRKTLVTRLRMLKIIDHMCDLGLIRCKADGKAITVEAVR